LSENVSTQNMETHIDKDLDSLVEEFEDGLDKFGKRNILDRLRQALESAKRIGEEAGLELMLGVIGTTDRVKTTHEMRATIQERLTSLKEK